MSKALSKTLAAFWVVAVFFQLPPVNGNSSLDDLKNIYSKFKTKTSGDGTYYGEQGGRGKCSLDPLSPLASKPGWIAVAAGPDTYLNSLGCGMCVKIKGSGQGLGHDPIKGIKRAVVVDECSECHKGLDLAVSGDGRWKISFKAINCPKMRGPAGKIQFKFQGSNPWYIKLQVRNAKIPAVGVEVFVGDRWRCLKRVPDNFFVGSGMGKVPFPLKVRLTSITGQQREATIKELKNDESLTSTVQFSGFKKKLVNPPDIKCHGQGEN